MASKYEIITALYRESVKGLAKNHHTWTAFLHSACYNYRLPFDEQVLIHAQRPDATAVLEIEGKNGWNQKFGRWVNRYATGIAVFDRHHAGRQRLKYYFDISDTHESRFARPVPIWEYKPEYEAAVIEALENRFGELRDKSDLQSALHSVAKNAVEDNLPDYLSELIRYRADSFLEDYDDLNVEVIYRRLLENSVAYMLMSRCGLDVDGYFEVDDFNDVINFNSPDTMNTLGVSTSDIAENCLGAIALTVRNLQREEKEENRTFAENAEKEYPIVSKPKTMSERSIEDGTDLHDEERLSSAEPVAPARAGGSPWEIRIASQKVSATEPKSEVHQSADVGQAERAPDGSGQSGKREDGTLGSTDGTSRGHHGGNESHRSDEMGGTDEQHPNVGGGTSAERVDLRINGENAGGEELPAFLDERLIMGIIANKEDDLKSKKHQIELFFSVHTDPKERAEYLKSAYHDRYTEVILDGGVRCGYKPQEDGLLMWEGAYLSRTKESVFSWDCIVGFTDQLIKKKEYSPGIINRRTKKLPPQDSNQLTLFDVFDMGATEPSEETPQLSLFPKWEASQQIIDETLCIGANERKSLLDICARFMKDMSVEENAEWLKEHYGTSGTGFLFEGRRIAVWYDANGIRIGEGDTAQRSTATVVTWEQAAKRIRELLDLGRYMPQKLIDQAADHENMHIAEYLIFAVRDFSEEADNAGYVPIIQQVIAEYHIFPDMPNKLIEYFKDPPMLQKLVDEWAEFTEAHKANPRLMRFKHHNPAKILGWLRNLQREPVIFRAAEGFDPKRERFITKDEIDRLLRGSEQRSDYRLGVYSFFRTHKDTKEREKYLREKFGTGGGTYDGNAYTNHDGKGYSFSRGDIMSPFAKITLSWAQVTKRITELYNRNSFLTEQDKEGMAEYEIGQLGRIIYNGFLGASDEHPKPFGKDDTSDYWNNVKSVAEQLKNPRRAEVIYTTMLLPLWESTLPNDRYYDYRKKAVEALQQYRDGVFSVFGNGRNLWLEQLKEQPQTAEPEKPMNPILKRLIEQREKYPEAIILLRVGDFYEAFDEDAHILAKTFDYTLTSRPLDGERDDTVTFEELGVDRLFIDESHYFKNLFLATKMRNVGGIAQTEAQKSSDLFMKCQYLDEITEGRGVIFATGTPISNSMVELYTIQRYLQYGLLDELGLQHFDDWAANYGETTTTIELSPEGSGYRPKTRFSKFVNLPELMADFKMCADIQTADMLKLPVPEAIFHNEVIKPSDLQKEAITGLAERAEAVRGGNVDPSVDNMLKITNDGRKLALDMRLFNPLAPDDENGKVATCARNVFRIWDEGKEERTTQLVFCDLSTPKGDGSFNVYEDLKQKLVERGIPEEEIAFIHDANTDARKKELFAKVRSGQVRILMGSTPKMGAGTNVQDRLVALHDLDCPWRPSDLAQRLGRIVRQGNRNKKVDIFRYVTEGTFDAYLYQLVENKQKFIAQIMTSKAPVRIASDVDETALNYAEIKALATGNPLIIEKCTLDMEVSKLNMLKASYLNQKYALEELVLRKYPADMSEVRERIAGYEKDLEIARAHPKIEDGFTGMVIMGVTHTEKETAGKAIIDACTRITDPDAIPLGEYRGFTMTLSYDGQANEYRITLKGALSHTVVLGSDIYGNITRMDNRIDGIEEQLKVLNEKLADIQTQLENARTEMEAPFAREAELAEKTRRLQELNVLLNLDAKDKTLMADEPDEGDKVAPRKNEYAR